MNLTFESIFTHEYFLAIYGIVVYYAIIREYTRRDFIKKHPKSKFDGTAWRKDNMGNFLVTALIAPLVIVFDDEILGLYNGFVEDDVQMGKWIYLMAGPVTDAIFRFFAQYKKKTVV